MLLHTALFFMPKPLKSRKTRSLGVSAMRCQSLRVLSSICVRAILSIMCTTRMPEAVFPALPMPDTHRMYAVDFMSLLNTQDSTSDSTQ